jgi:hypothetical protein
VVFLLAGCGDVEEDTSTAQATGVAAIDLLASSTQVPSDGSDSATLTAVVRDGNNQVVEGKDVTFRSSSGALQVTQGTTDASGQATAEITPGGDPTVRTITVTASVGATQDSVDVEVSGTTLSLDGPSSLVSGNTGTWTVTLQDSAGGGITGESVQVSSTQGHTLSGSSLTTDSSGQVQFELTADAGTGTDTLTAQSAGLTANDSVDVSGQNFRFTAPQSGTEVDISPNTQAVTIRWEDGGTAKSGQQIDFSTTRGGFAGNGGNPTDSATTDANGDASVTIESSDAGFATITASGPAGSPSAQRTIEFVATTAATLSLQADPATISPNETSKLTAVVRDGSGNLVKNKTIIFNLTDSTGGQLTTGTATTDSQGRATTTYQASSTTSGKDGVSVSAEVKRKPSVSDTSTLTVAQQALRVTLGTGDSMEEPTDQQYAQPFVILVSDSNGNAIEGATVNLSLEAVQFYKGIWVQTDTDSDGTADVWAQWYDTTDDGQGDTSGVFVCPNEDTDLDGTKDAGEDSDGDGVLEPGNPAAVSSQSVTTDANGFAEVKVVYPQSEGGWSQVTLEATVNVAGSEGSARSTFDLGILADEYKDLDTSMPGGSPGPYGIRDDCADLN